jgi:hypothetical protein
MRAGLALQDIHPAVEAGVNQGDLAPAWSGVNR